ncbi:NAD(P)/FAD-dependent oxidoreductase [Tumebacillus sp. ITR2]|uniref:NAD(P)/FAD-dependent oxidoreductase n=1 Tax=Tumebacillus amylolyticus TaxID=2801339 RepID=A0ABS1J801_9BACL|nr:NAD(P)/FAD-dependent oxidoreductase [Tumebacillus amylolyticus]MBL0386403.1 NAD(P)/FAD-dependent oxidoreductase [Tumebacillus amylolyticus]
MKATTDVVILGGGPAGLSAAIWCRRLGLHHLLLEQGMELGGQLHAIHNEIIDYPGILAANGYEVKRVFEENVRRVGCDVETGVRVLEVDVAQQVLWWQTSEQAGTPEVSELHFQSLILATGSGDRRLRVPGEAEMLKRGEVYSASRDSALFSGKKVAVVGGGDRALEGALLLADGGAQVTLIHRSERFRARAEFRNRVLSHPGIELLTYATVTSVLGSDHVTGLEVALPGGEVRKLAAEALFVRVGVEPSSHLVRGQIVTDEDGFVEVDEVGQTSVEFVMAIGDVCTRPVYSSIAKAVGHGMTAAKHLSVVLAERREIW